MNKRSKDLLKQCHKFFYVPGIHTNQFAEIWDKENKREKVSANGITDQGSKGCSKTWKKIHYCYAHEWICLSSSHLEIIFPRQLRKMVQKQILKSRSLACFESRCFPGILNTILKKPIVFLFSSSLLFFIRPYFCQLWFCPQWCLQNAHVRWVRISNVVARENKGTHRKMHLRSQHMASA